MLDIRQKKIDKTEPVKNLIHYHTNHINVSLIKTQQTFTCSNSVLETLEKSVKYV